MWETAERASACARAASFMVTSNGDQKVHYYPSFNIEF
jgi:hypothetical protein